MSTRQKKQHGYLLIEAMVAMGVLTTSVLGIFALMSQSIKFTRVIDDQYVGTYLAAEGVELTKNLLDTNTLSGGAWNAGGFASAGCYEIDVNSDMLPGVGCPETPLKLKNQVYSYDPTGATTGFSRSVDITPIIDPVDGTTQDGVQVVSTVKWAGGASSIVLEDKFYNWHK